MGDDFQKPSVTVENLEPRLLLSVFVKDFPFASGGELSYDQPKISQRTDGSYDVFHQQSFFDGPEGGGDFSHREYYHTRLKADGSVDTSFGNNGSVDLGTYEPHAAGSRYYAFASNQSFPDIIAYTSDGKYDKSFSGDGAMPVPYLKPAGPRKANEVFGREVHAGPDGDVFVSYTVQDNTFASSLQVVRLNANGSIDTSWGENGFYKFASGGLDFFIGNSNKFYTYEKGTNSRLLRRYLPDGKTPDASFGGGDGIAEIGNGSRITERPDGKLYYVTYDSSTTDSERHARLNRLNSDGSIDGTFGQNGNVSLYRPGNDQLFPSNYAENYLFDSSGRIWVGASGSIFRFSTDGVLEPAPFNGTIDIDKEMIAIDRVTGQGAFFKGGLDPVVRYHESARNVEVGTDHTLYISGNASDDIVSVTLENDGRLHTRVNGTPTNVRAKGIDRIEIQLFDGNNSVTADTDIPVHIRTGDGKDTFNLAAEDDDVQTGRGNDTINLGEGDNVVHVGPDSGSLKDAGFRSTVTAGDGDNSVFVFSGRTTIELGAGDNEVRLNASAADSKINIAGGSNTVYLAGKDDTLTIGGKKRQNVTIARIDHAIVNTGDGDDTFNIDARADVYSHGGNDRFFVLGDADRSVDIDAGDGDDSVEPQSTNMTGMFGIIRLGYGNDYLRGTTSRQDVYGGPGNDTLIGGDGNITYHASGDALDGGDGNDRIFGAEGDDLIMGGPGNDYIKAGRGDDRVSAGAGRDKVWGNDGNDDINGGVHDDTISGGLGNDTLNGGIDRDILLGDEGNDSFDDRDRSLDNLIGGPGRDSAQGDRDLDIFDSSIETIV